MTKEEAKKMGATHCGFCDKNNIVYLRKYHNKWEKIGNDGEWRYLIFTLRDIKPI